MLDGDRRKNREQNGGKQRHEAENARDLEMKASARSLPVAGFQKLEDLEPHDADNDEHQGGSHAKRGQDDFVRRNDGGQAVQLRNVAMLDSTAATMIARLSQKRGSLRKARTGGVPVMTLPAARTGPGSGMDGIGMDGTGRARRNPRARRPTLVQAPAPARPADLSRCVRRSMTRLSK